MKDRKAMAMISVLIGMILVILVAVVAMGMAKTASKSTEGVLPNATEPNYEVIACGDKADDTCVKATCFNSIEFNCGASKGSNKCPFGTKVLVLDEIYNLVVLYVTVTDPTAIEDLVSNRIGVYVKIDQYYSRGIATAYYAGATKSIMLSGDRSAEFAVEKNELAEGIRIELDQYARFDPPKGETTIRVSFQQEGDPEICVIHFPIDYDTSP